MAVAAIGALTLDANSHALSDGKKVAPTTYEGTTGKIRLVLTTKGCCHETPENGEEATFNWTGLNGRLTFVTNADVCEVIAYREK